jgi:hypothetical protein
MIQTMAGGCACGRIRFVAEVEGRDAYLCHCRMCQRASGNVSLALFTLPQASVTWELEPDWYDSSAIAQRPFCSSCGTSLGFRYREDTDRMDLTVAAFDEPAGFIPVSHFGAESLHEAWLDTRQLPRQRSEDYARLAQRWQDAASAPPQ